MHNTQYGSDHAQDQSPTDVNLGNVAAVCRLLPAIESKRVKGNGKTWDRRLSSGGLFVRFCFHHKQHRPNINNRKWKLFNSWFVSHGDSNPWKFFPSSSTDAAVVLAIIDRLEFFSHSTSNHWSSMLTNIALTDCAIHLHSRRAAVCFSPSVHGTGWNGARNWNEIPSQASLSWAFKRSGSKHNFFREGELSERNLPEVDNIRTASCKKGKTKIERAETTEK